MDMTTSADWGHQQLHYTVLSGCWINSLVEAGKLRPFGATGKIAAAGLTRQHDGMLTLDSVSLVSHEEHVGVLGPWSLGCLLSIADLCPLQLALR